MLGTVTATSTTTTLTTIPSTLVIWTTEDQGPPQRSDRDHSPPVGMARPMANDCLAMTFRGTGK